MKNTIIFVSLWLCLAGLVFSQSSRSNKVYGAKGLAITEEILAELNLPVWCWSGAHLFDNVAQNYQLVDGEVLDDFFTIHPAKGLNDPQNILNDRQRRKIEKLIADHDMKSAMPLYINLMAYGQKLSLNEEDLKVRLRKMLAGRSGLVVFYYYGYVRGVKGYVLLDELGFIEDWEVVELFLKSARDASMQVDDFREMASFVTEVSKRSYWLEQRLIPPVIAEKNNEPKDNTKKNRGIHEQWLLILTDHTMTLVLFLWVLAAAVWYYLWSRKWRKYIILNADVSVRLGANHGANVSDTIEFSDPKVSLTKQYERVKSREL
jgi:hypothetical protein